MNSNPKDFNGRLEETNNLNRVKKMYSFLGKLPRYYGFWSHVTFMGRERSIRRNAVEKLNLKKGDRVLEIACGTGRDFPYLIEAIGNEGSLVGFDYTQEMLDSAGGLCRQRGWENVEFVRGDAAELDLAEKDFDGVLAVLCFSIMHNWVGILQRSRNFLRPGGRLAVCDQQPFKGGVLKVLNPLVRLFLYGAVADWRRNIPEKMKEVFGNVEVQHFNSGSIFVARSIKE